MTLHGPVPSGRVLVGDRLYVDATYAGAVSNGSFEEPFTTITGALAVAAAGDLIYVAPGAYVEDVALVDGVDLEGAQAGAVLITGTITATDVTCVLENLVVTDDTGGGPAFNFTGVAANTVRCILCEFNGTATGDHPVLCDNTHAAGTVNMEGCTVTMDVANAAAAISVASGVLTLRECDVVHADNTAESVELLGTAASTFEARDTTFTGTVACEAAAVAPACTLTNCNIIVGAVSAGVIAATCTMTYLEGNVTSTDGGQDAFDGAGTMLVKDIGFLSTADEYATTLTVTQAVGSLIQHGTVAAAGASPQTDSVVFAQVMPDVNYTISLTPETTGGAADATACTVDEGTIATTGFDVVTTDSAAAAIGCNIHYIVIHD